MCFVDLEKPFDRVLKKMLEWAMRKKGIPEVLVRSVKNLYEGAKTRDRVDSKLSEEFEVIVVMHQVSVLSQNIAREGAPSLAIFATAHIQMSYCMPTTWS